jgi:Fur family ferric uptake transcriptional regulator
MKALDILTISKLRRTSCREGIIELVLSSDVALSELEIRERLVGNYDRTTYYRSFKTLKKHNILHKIVIDEQNVKYALDKSFTDKNEHAHFYCCECQMVKCLDAIPFSNFKLPEGYTKSETEIIIKGSCSDCKNETA